MILHSPNSRTALMNSLSDYILSKIDINETSIIRCVDFRNFVVIKGKTTSKDVLILPEIINELKEKYLYDIFDEDILHSTIDLIEYDCELEHVDVIKQKYYCSEICNFNNRQYNNFLLDSEKSYNDDSFGSEIKEELICYSNFPNGYSLNSGRILYYFGKKIIYNIPPDYPFHSLTLSIDKNLENISVYDEYNHQEDLILKSAILDCIDLDLTKLKNQLLEESWFLESLNPIKEYEFLKEKVKDFIII